MDTRTEEDHLAEFRQYCENAPDNQALGIYEKEMSSTDPARQPYQEIARDEARRRGFEV